MRQETGALTSMSRFPWRHANRAQCVRLPDMVATTWDTGKGGEGRTDGGGVVVTLDIPVATELDGPSWPGTATSATVLKLHSLSLYFSFLLSLCVCFSLALFLYFCVSFSSVFSCLRLAPIFFTFSGLPSLTPFLISLLSLSSPSSLNPLPYPKSLFHSPSLSPLMFSPDPSLPHLFFVQKYPLCPPVYRG